MSIEARLSAILPALTAKERAILVLRSLKDRTPEDPKLRRAMPAEQTTEFNRLIVLMNACNMYLPLYITMVEGHTQELNLRFSWLLTLARFGSHTWYLAGLIPASKRAQAEKLVAGANPAVEFPWQADEVEDSWVTVTERALEAIRSGVISLWQELKAIDVVLDEVAGEFDGEDPLRPVMRVILEKARFRLTELHALLTVAVPFELPEQDEEALALARKYFESGWRLLQSL